MKREAGARRGWTGWVIWLFSLGMVPIIFALMNIVSNPTNLPFAHRHADFEIAIEKRVAGKVVSGTASTGSQLWVGQTSSGNIGLLRHAETIRQITNAGVSVEITVSKPASDPVDFHKRVSITKTLFVPYDCSVEEPLLDGYTVRCTFR